MMLKRERLLLHQNHPPFVIALSDYVAGQLRDHYGVPADRIRRVFNGVDPDPCDEFVRARDRRDVRGLYEIEDDELFVLLVAHNFRLKGVRSWLEALAVIKQDGALPVKSLVVGKGASVRWQRLARSMGVSDYVQFPGPTQRVRAFFHAADVLVHPTFYDPCSRVVLEALASGLPAITTRYDGAAEAIQEGGNGFVLASPEDVPGLVDRVGRMADAALRWDMAKRASGLADRLTMRRHAEGVCEVYRELLAETRPG
jgi:UDP-glucose:(heptosyl)LPS alpha-1,3-glucosyltransferase